MRAGDLLETDLSVLLPQAWSALRSAVAWWLEELAGMLPEALGRPAGDAGAPVAWRRPDGAYEVAGRGVFAAGGDRRPLKVALALAPSLLLTRSLPAPPLPDRDVRRMTRLDLDRLTPFSEADVYADVRVSRGGDGDRWVLIAVARRGVAEAEFDAAGAAGLRPVALVPPEPGSGLDLLPAMRAAGVVQGGGNAAAWWWSAVAALVVLNVACWVWRDSRDVAALEFAVAAQSPEVHKVMTLRSGVAAEAARRARLAAGGGAGGPLAALDAASHDLPDGAWVERASLEGGRLTLAGQRRSDIDVAAALRADPRFESVESAGGDLDDASAAGTEPFQVVATLAPGRVR